MREKTISYTAAIHEIEMSEIYEQDIETSVENSILYGETSVDPKYDENHIPEIVLEEIGSSAAVFKHRDENPCLLNFASFKHPGGGYKYGAHAQEESICAESTLYNVLTEFRVWYNENKKHYNNGLYADRAIFSPGIVFDREKNDDEFDIAYSSIITCAAPNAKVASENGLYKKDIEKAMSSRIKFILDIAQKENVKTLILGAFGCGVFKNDPTFVANEFMKLLKSGKYSFEKVIFAIPKNGKNISFFKEVIK